MLNFSAKGKQSPFQAIAIAALVGLLAAGTGFAQSSRGTVTGLVTDPTKSSISSASVELTNVDTQVARSTSTNEAGSYRFDAVDPGNYTVKVTSSGFKVTLTQPFTVQAAQVASIDAQLEVGQVTNVVEVSAASAQLQTEAPVRGGTINTQNIVELPIASQNPVALALTLPGVTTSRYSFGTGTFSVNGGRARSNNFLIDGTENNDISVTGQAFQIKNPDAVQELSLQTGNYDSEYGRAGGGVVNVVTRSGSNTVHGTVRYLLDSTFDDAPTNLQKLSPAVLDRGHPLPGQDQIFSGTIGGPIKRNKTFFFSMYQEERQNSTSQVGLTTLSASGRAALLSLFPAGTNTRADLLRQVTAGADANSQFFDVSAGAGRPTIQFGTYQRPVPTFFRDRQLLERVDHTFNTNDQLSARYMYDDGESPVGGSTGFNGFDTGYKPRVQSVLATETHTFSPVATNELRLAYNRIFYFFPNDATNPLAATLPNISIAGATTALGIASNLPQGRVANNYELQDTVNYIRGKHSFRFGTSLLNQRSKQAAPFNGRGTLSYTASTGYTGLANFLDDFGGSSGSAARDFGSPNYYPSLFRQAYFGQDRWRVTEALTLTLGVRYEYFGVPINSIPTPAFTGLFNINPQTLIGPYSQPNSVKPDKNNFAPTLGIAYAPSFGSGLMNRLFGEKRTVFRAGYQIGYDSFFNNIASNALASSPNLVSTSVPSQVTTDNPRGLAGLSTAFPQQARALLPSDSQTLVLSNLVNPYYQRWSAGFQRELPAHMVLDVSYVGSKGTKLFVNEDLNPLVPASLRIFPAGYSATSTYPVGFTPQLRLDPLQGSRVIRTNGGSSTYESAQVELKRRYSSGIVWDLSYTRAKFIDNSSDVFSSGGNNLPSQTAVPSIYGGLTSDRAVSLYDRPNRLTLTFLYQLPFFKEQHGFLGRAAGGWEVSGYWALESGAPLNILNGLDADGLGGGTWDRPNYNPAGQPGVRAVYSTTSPTNYVNPDNGNAPINSSDAMYIGLPACTNPTPCPGGNLGRFTLRTPRQDNLDTSLTKTVRMTERFGLQFRAEFYNVLNHRQYGFQSISPFDSGTTTISANVATSPAGRFLQPGFADGGARVIKYQLKLTF